MTDCLRPDLAILDPEITMTMPDHVAAETGMDALTHAIEAYTNHNLDDFDEGLCSSAVIGIMKWLPVSVFDKTLEAREKYIIIRQWQESDLQMSGLAWCMESRIPSVLLIIWRMV